MVGYIQEPYTKIGFASAKLDDIANFVPARIGSVFMVLAGALLGYKGKKGIQILARDRKPQKPKLWISRISSGRVVGSTAWRYKYIFWTKSI